MLPYRASLKTNARTLRRDMTDAEQTLWSKLRRKQILDVQFCRQKPIGPYIVDFHAPAAGLVVELDGSQHLETDAARRDAVRDAYLTKQGMKVLRFDNLQVLKELEAVLNVIESAIRERRNPPQPPFHKGGGGSLSGESDNPSKDVPPFEKGGLGGIPATGGMSQ